MGKTLVKIVKTLFIIFFVPSILVTGCQKKTTKDKQTEKVTGCLYKNYQGVEVFAIDGDYGNIEYVKNNSDKPLLLTDVAILTNYGEFTKWKKLFSPGEKVFYNFFSMPTTIFYSTTPDEGMYIDDMHGLEGFMYIGSEVCKSVPGTTAEMKQVTITENKSP